MRQIVKDDILAVLNDVLLALEQEDYVALGELSNHVIHDASIFQEDDPLTFAVLVYALSKVIFRCIESQTEQPTVIQRLKAARKALERNDDSAYRAQIKSVLRDIAKCDSKLKLYIQEVVRKARIKKGSKIHEHGISIARTAEILGISQWELQEYVGQTKQADIHGVSLHERLRFARGLFK